MEEKKGKLSLLIKLITICIVIVVLFYSGAWFYTAQSIKETFRSNNNIRFATSKNLKHHISFKSATITGFPFQFKVIIDKPSYKAGLLDNSYEFYADSLILKSNVFGTRYKAILKGDVSNIMRTDSKMERYATKSETEPYARLTVDRSKQWAFPWITSLPPQSINEFIERFRQFEYVTNHTKQFNQQGEWVSKYDGSHIRILSHNTNLKRKLHVVFSVDDLHFANPALVAENANNSNPSSKFLSLYDDLGAFNIQLDMSYNGPNKEKDIDRIGINLDLHDLDIRFSSFGLAAKGNIIQRSRTTDPVGEVTVALSGYEKLVDHVFDQVELQQFVMQENKAAKPYTADQRQMVKEFLRSISLTPTEKTNDITINVKRNSGTPPTVSRLSIPEVLEKWQTVDVALQ